MTSSRPLIYTGAYSAARWQELAGLQRANLDLARGKMHVRTVIERGSTEPKAVPQSNAGRRTIGFNKGLVEILRLHLARSADTELAFPNRKGGIPSEQTFVSATGSLRLSAPLFHP